MPAFAGMTAVSGEFDFKIGSNKFTDEMTYLKNLPSPLFAKEGHDTSL
jgi:hypothetical protein